MSARESICCLQHWTSPFTLSGPPSLDQVLSVWLSLSLYVCPTDYHAGLLTSNLSSPWGVMGLLMHDAPRDRWRIDTYRSVWFLMLARQHKRTFYNQVNSPECSVEDRVVAEAWLTIDAHKLDHGTFRDWSCVLKWEHAIEDGMPKSCFRLVFWRQALFTHNKQYTHPASHLPNCSLHALCTVFFLLCSAWNGIQG